MTMDHLEHQPREVLVDVQNLTKHFGRIRAVDGISFQVRRGDILGFLGPNGAGKSTAMKMISCFLEPDAGNATVAGHTISDASLELRQRIGYLPENAPSYGEMTVDGFLRFVAEARAIEDIENAVTKVVGMTGLGTVLHQTIDTLSKGFKRRVGLAQAMIHDPDVLILDEPTDGLDPNQKAMVQDLIAGLAENKAIILSTHILDEVERVCNRALIISEGRIVVDSTPDELLQQAPNHNVIRVTLENPSDELISAITEQPWCLRVDRVKTTVLDVFPADGGNHLPELLALLEGRELQSIHLQEGRLNELFRSLTEGVCA
jgi:ABC-2 type transport system ATP-binding protein